MKNDFCIIFTIDELYIQHFTVALTSLLENNKDIDCEIFVINDIKDLTLLNEIKKFFHGKYKVDISLISLDNSLFEHYKITEHVSRATYFRLMIADIIPQYINKALFLDSDLIVTGSIKQLMEFKFKDNFIFAASEINLPGINVLKKVGIDASTYFNAGVMLLNLKAWRDNNVSSHLILTAQKYMAELMWWDQDVLNIHFYNKWDELPSTYNKRDLKKRLKETPVIVHFSGYSKPWQYLNSHPYKKLYWKYLKLSPFKNYKYKDFSIKNLIKRIVFFNKSL